MITMHQTKRFSKWLERLRDATGRARIVARLVEVSAGHFGDHHSVGGGVHELRFMFGPGYRVYFLKHGTDVVVLLAGGDKSSQSDDIAAAKKLAQDWESK